MALPGGRYVLEFTHKGVVHLFIHETILAMGPRRDRVSSDPEGSMGSRYQHVRYSKRLLQW